MLKNDMDPARYPALLDNKFGITDLQTLLKVESERSAQRAREILTNPQIAKGNFDAEHLKNLHKYLFQDVYPWAGDFRDGMISKGGSMFCHPNYIGREMDASLKKLKAVNFGKGQPPEALTDTLTTLSDDLNAIHPFREGNGRSKRLFLQLVAANAGYDLDYSKITTDQLMQAEIGAFKTGNTTGLNSALKKCLSPQTPAQAAGSKGKLYL